METRPQLLKLLRSHLTPKLRDLGFAKVKSWYEKRVADVILFVHAQGHMSASGAMRATINLYVGSTKVQEMFPDVFFAIEPGIGPIDRRIGSLLEPEEDIWWDISSPEKAQQASAEILSLLETRGIPFLEQFQTTADMAPYLRIGKHTGMAKEVSQYIADAIDGIADPSKNPWKD